MGTMVRKEIHSRFQIHIICMSEKKKKNSERYFHFRSSYTEGYAYP